MRVTKTLFLFISSTCFVVFIYMFIIFFILMKVNICLQGIYRRDSRIQTYEIWRKYNLDDKDLGALFFKFNSNFNYLQNKLNCSIFTKFFIRKLSKELLYKKFFLYQFKAQKYVSNNIRLKYCMTFYLSTFYPHIAMVLEHGSIN